VSLAALSLLYLYFLTEIAGLRPALASLVLLVGRVLDAFADPLMGRLSDVTAWRWGRRRPYFLLAAVPFGASFALLWQSPELDSQAMLFATYAALYLVHTIASTVLGVPYMALLPELALGYDARTALNVFRQAGSVAGALLAAVMMRPLVDLFGGGGRGFAYAGAVLGVWMAVPWFVVYAVTWERPALSQPVHASFVDGVRRVAAHRAYRVLVGVFLCARVALDLLAAMIVFYLAYWLHREPEFAVVMATMLIAASVSLPMWLRAARHADKATIFLIGAGWWMATEVALFILPPEWPSWVMFAVAAATGVGYAAVDLMPWSMLGDVVDADELATGERSDGIYAGTFTFLRKLGGATGVALAGLALDVAGFVPGEEQSPSVLWTIRVLTAVVPATFLAVAAALARSYPLGRRRHAEIVAALEGRRKERHPR
jgi:sugar (glycoside-pentoside-hexuronide) transporter